MKYILIILLLIASGSSCQKKNNIQPMPGTISLQPVSLHNDTGVKNFAYLALGDSYTIGHDVAPPDNYPNQTLNLLRKYNLYGQVKIIATTGWTTQNLKAAIESDNTLLPKYDIVTLLIGVNNEYQGQSAESYKPEFEDLLKKAIAFAGSNADHVVVLSIPDWSVTPFATGRDRNKIATEIDAFNAINEEVAGEYKVNYLGITPWTREAANDLTLLASDGLHPSGKEYARWADKLAEIINRVLKQ